MLHGNEFDHLGHSSSRRSDGIALAENRVIVMDVLCDYS
jgi:hypothetical protein